jgi:hypothetical protein
MPVNPHGIPNYDAVFLANGVNAGFDVSSSGYGESVPANFTARAIPWSPTLSVVVQSGGLNPITRTYQATVYQESDYQALRSIVGFLGTLTTPREGVVPATAAPAMLSGVRRGNYQYPAWPGDDTGDGRDIQTLQLDFVMFA